MLKLYSFACNPYTCEEFCEKELKILKLRLEIKCKKIYLSNDKSISYSLKYYIYIMSRIGFSFKIYVALWQIASKIIVRNNNIVTFAMTTFDIMCFSKFY